MDRTIIFKIVISTLIAVSFSLFFAQLGNVVRRILQSTPEPPGQGYALGHRLWNFVWQVLCQANVIQRRPIAGVAHAFLLWGFFAFLVAELDHFTRIFGIALIDRDSELGVFYFWLFFLFAAGLTAAIAILILRRHIFKAESLDPITHQTTLTLVLIFIVAITMLPLWWMSDPTLLGDLVWWLHTLAVLVLVPLLPRGKNLHILLGPASLFLKRPTFSQIPAARIENKPGILNGPDIRRLTALQAYSCVECGRCTEVCPAHATGKELDPRLIALGINYYLDEFGPSNQTPILETAISPKAIFECTTCGACETHCPVGVQHLSMIIGLRQGAVRSEKWKDPSAEQLFQNLLNQGNTFGVSETEREQFVAAQQLPIFNGSQEYCLWLGCMGAYDPRGRTIVSAFVEVMNHLGTSYGVLSKEYCTGDPARRLGNDFVTQSLANINIKILERSGARKIVSVCPHCVRTMAEDWNQLRPTAETESDDPSVFDVTIEHHTEFLARHADRLPVYEDGPKVVFHDPCYLGRYRNVYDDPRYVLARSSTLVEPKRTRETSFCCGAGGGLVFLGEESGGQRMSVERANELVATGAQVVATACPFCTVSLREARPDSGETEPLFWDIAQIIAEQVSE